jgi:hypothetical protein
MVRINQSRLTRQPLQEPLSIEKGEADAREKTSLEVSLKGNSPRVTWCRLPWERGEQSDVVW